MILVAGAGGFIGGHLAKRLKREGNDVLCVDIKPLDEWFQVDDYYKYSLTADLRDINAVKEIFRRWPIDQVYNLACNMGGMGFIESHKAQCMLSSLINTNLLWGSIINMTPDRYLFTSTACVYRDDTQNTLVAKPLRELEDVYPAMPEDGYGWEKLFGERMCRHFRQDYGLETRVARLFTAYGPDGSWEGGREKAPAAICRKIAEAKLTGAKEIEIWGDGHQLRNFTYIDDVVEGLCRIMDGDYPHPLNVGIQSHVSINWLVRHVQKVAGYEVSVKHIEGPLGVRARNSDNSLILSKLDWQPTIPISKGIEKTYAWIEEQVIARANER